MKIKEPTFEIWEQKKGVGGMFLQIERAGRVCYKSDNKITGKVDDAIDFVKRLINSKHLSVLEHGTVRALIDEDSIPDFLFHNQFTRVVPYAKDNKCLVVTNYRVLVENDITWLLNHFYDEDEAVNNLCRRITVHFNTQIAISRELNRHRVNSVSESSTRYCNYSKDKFGGEITINLPKWVNDIFGGDKKHISDFACSDSYNGEQQKLFRNPYIFMSLAMNVYKGKATDIENWLFVNLAAERAYMNLVNNKHTPQEARVILPLDTNTEIVHTAFINDWKHFFDLRALCKTGKPHPDAVLLAKPLYEEFKKHGYME